MIPEIVSGVASRTSGGRGGRRGGGGGGGFWAVDSPAMWVTLALILLAIIAVWYAFHVRNSNSGD